MQRYGDICLNVTKDAKLVANIILTTAAIPAASAAEIAQTDMNLSGKSV